MDPTRQRQAPADPGQARQHAREHARRKSPGIRIPDHHYRMLLEAIADDPVSTQATPTAPSAHASGRESLPGSSRPQAGSNAAQMTARGQHSGLSSHWTNQQRHSSTSSYPESSGFARPPELPYAHQHRTPSTPTAAVPAIPSNPASAGRSQINAYSQSAPASQARNSSHFANRPEATYYPLPRPPPYPATTVTSAPGIRSAGPVITVRPRRLRAIPPDLTDQQVEELTVYLWSEVAPSVRPSRQSDSNASQANTIVRPARSITYKGDLEPGDRAVLECTGSELFTDSSGGQRKFMVITQKGKRRARDRHRTRHRWMKSGLTDALPDWAGTTSRARKSLFCCMGSYSPDKTVYRVTFYPQVPSSSRETA